MTDPRRPVHSVDNPILGAHLMRRVHDHLLTATENGCEDMGMNGLSFVLAGTMAWIGELSEIEPKATSAWLRAMAIIMDPDAPHAVKLSAERKRKVAVRKIMAAADLMMSKPEGTA